MDYKFLNLVCLNLGTISLRRSCRLPELNFSPAPRCNLRGILSTFQRIYWPLGWVPLIHLSFICPFSFFLFLTSIWILALCRVEGWTPFELQHATGKKNLAVVQHNLQLHSSYSEIQVHFFLTAFTHLVTKIHSWSNFFISSSYCTQVHMTC